MSFFLKKLNVKALFSLASNVLHLNSRKNSGGTDVAFVNRWENKDTLILLSQHERSIKFNSVVNETIAREIDLWLFKKL